MSFLPLSLFFVVQVEVFNILFIREQEKRHVVHCMDCARKQSPSLEGFVCLEEYKLSEICSVYDQFRQAPMVSETCNLIFCPDFFVFHGILKQTFQLSAAGLNPGQHLMSTWRRRD